MTDVRNTDNVIDSRDVIARIEELEDERNGLVSDVDEAKEAYDKTDTEAEDYDAVEEKFSYAATALSDWDDDNGDELKALQDLQDKAEGYAEGWKYGATLVNEDYWTEYVQELLEDCGELPKDLPPYIVIDWNKTAENIQVDYTSVEFDGTTFWVR